MKVLVRTEVDFEVEVETHDYETAKRAVEANWDTVYKHRAKWVGGMAPALSARQVRVIEEIK